MRATRRETLVSWLIITPFAIVLAFPFYWMLMTALRADNDLYDIEQVPFKFNADSPTLSNFRFLFEETDYREWLQNTAIVGGAVVLITLVLALPAAYALARLLGGWGQTLGVGIFLIYLVPPTLLFLPLSRLVAELHLHDRLWSLILVYPSFTVPFSIWLLMGFFKTIPPELEDAALVDGASRLTALVRAGDPYGGHLHVLAGCKRVRLRNHVHLEQRAEDDLRRRADGADPRRRLLLGSAHGSHADPRDSAGTALQRLPQPLHRRLHRRRLSMSQRKESNRAKP